MDSRTSQWKRAAFIGPSQLTTVECLSSWLFLALCIVDCHVPKWISLKHVGLQRSVSFYLLFGSHVCVAEVVVTVSRQMTWSSSLLSALTTSAVGWRACGPKGWLAWVSVGKMRWFLWGCGWSQRLISFAVHQGWVLRTSYWTLLLFTTVLNLFLNTVS